MKEDKYLTTRELASYLNISPRRAQDLMNVQDFKSVKFANKWLIKRSHVDEYMQNNFSYKR